MAESCSASVCNCKWVFSILMLHNLLAIVVELLSKLPLWGFLCKMLHMSARKCKAAVRLNWKDFSPSHVYGL